MNINRDWYLRKQRIRVTFGAVIFVALVSVTAQADAPHQQPVCNALVSAANNLLLVSPTGQTLVKFTSDGTQKEFAVISPDGTKVAYSLLNSTDDTYQVVDKYGRQGAFSAVVSPPDHKSSGAENEGALGPLLNLSWSTNSVLRLEKHISPSTSRFEFQHIPEDLTPPAHEEDAAFDENCVLNHDSGAIACIEREGHVLVGSGGLNESTIFSASGFDGVAPQESLTLTTGTSTTTTSTPNFKVAVKNIDKNGILLSVTSPDGASKEELIDNGSYLPVTYWDSNNNIDLYGFFATVVNAKAGAVQIEVVKSNSGQYVFDPALTWLPDGQGLLLIRRTTSQSVLYLIQPGRGDVSGHPASGRGPQWHLAAQTIVSLPGQVRSVRFLTPSLLLLDTGNLHGPQFSELPIHLANGQDNGKPSLKVGTAQPLPSTIVVTINGQNTQAPVLGWSCATRHGGSD